MFGALNAPRQTYALPPWAAGTGAEIVVESGKPVAVIHAPVPSRRSMSECIALLPEDPTATIEADFARDVEAAVESHREPLEPPSWD